jgi:hypothetical protein
VRLRMNRISPRRIGDPVKRPVKKGNKFYKTRSNKKNKKGHHVTDWTLFASHLAGASVAVIMKYI